MRASLRMTIIVFAALALVAGAAGCSTDSTGTGAAGTAKGEPIKIGAVLSLTGTYAALGESEKNALELEVERINEAGGIDGRPVEIIIEDDATDEAKAVAAASKLIEQDRVVAILGATGTGQTMAMRSEIQRAGVPQVSMAGGTVITDQFDPLVFQTPWSNRLVVPFVLDAIKDAGIGSEPSKSTRIALITDTGGYGKDGLAVIQADIARRAASSNSADSFEIVAEETFNPGDSDMSAQVTRVKRANPDVVLLWTAGKEGAIVVKNARDLGLEAPLYGGSGQARLEFIEGAGEASEGFTFGTGRSLVPENWPKDSEQFAAVSDFSERYAEAYGENPDIFAGHAFDAFAIVTEALASAGPDADAAELRDAIEGTADLAGFGGSFSFSAADHNGLAADDLALYKVEDGAWKTIE